MKKILLLGALILSVNAYSASLRFGGGAAPSGNYSVSNTVSGNIIVTGPAGSAGGLYLGIGEKVLKGTTITVGPGIYLGIYGARTIGGLNGPVTYVFPSDVLDTDTTLPPSAPAPAPSVPGAPGTPNVPSTPGTKKYIPRSKVDLELTKNITSSGFKSLEDAKNDNGVGFDVQYIGGAGRYTDNSQAVKYDSKSNGVALVGTKNFGNFTLGGGFGYQKSKVKYKEAFDGIKENLDSYQFMLNGKYNFTENVDLAGVLTYSHNSHKYENRNKVAIEGTNRIGSNKS